MIVQVMFTAYNLNTNIRESFVCRQIEGLHKDAQDAATSALWYGECWGLAQMRSADVRIED
ncbi:hypothetical protein [Pseudomonas sp.]|jgi:hypothetical protein|uniref:hypothetical protein n=1 Tax=Pseudomonas sp. TaxID=306 RepID=UPI002EDA0A28